MKTLLAFSFLLPALTTLSPAAEPSAPPAGARPNVLLVTGQDGPWHDWRHTAPVLRACWSRTRGCTSARSRTRPSWPIPSIQEYDAVVLHFVNWEVPSPGTAARENFKKYLAGGKGVMLVHFACGRVAGLARVPRPGRPRLGPQAAAPRSARTV